MVDVAPGPSPEALDDGLGDVPLRRARHHRSASQEVSARPRHFPCFDGLRAIAAILVVLVHASFASGFTSRSSSGIYTARLEIGVSVFFLISGFLLYRPFAASHITGSVSPSVGKFWMRRFLRIMPAYWLAFVVTSYVLHANHKVLAGWHSLLIYLGLLQVYFPSHALTGITQAWSLCTEVSFYLALPLYAALMALRRRSDRHQLRRELLGLLGLFGTGLGFRFFLLHVHTALAHVMLDWLPSCLDLFALGMLLAVLSSWVVHRDVQPRWLWNPVMPAASWLIALAALWAVSHLDVSRLPLEHTAPGRGLLQELLYGLFAFFLLLPAVFGPKRAGIIRKALQCKPVVGLGVVSYGVYLWHQAWVDLFVRWTGELFRIPLPEMFGVVSALAVASATASYLLVERPILRLKNRLSWWSPSAPASAGAP
jgi:peptidoglycan/LPS O-acetylase OafA/YrhL